MERLKQKVASSSSRVIASLQQAATGTFQANSSRQDNKQQQVPIHELAAGQVGSMLMADADATAHLTEEEREILLEVFKKEAEFQRDTIIQMGGAGQSQQELTNHQQEMQNQAISSKQQPLHQQQEEYINRVQSRRSSQRDRFPVAQRQTSSSSGSRQQPHHYQSPSSFAGSSQASPSPATMLETTTSGSSISTTTAATYLTSARSSATPTSRPASTVFAGTPIGNARARESSAPRTGSSCSSTAAQQQQQQQPLGHCRICRKFISTNEPCHLCSNCNQFICEDCASYSANDQHWMCSSCRRRATKPAIPAEALRELGLNQNSSPVRRMTLRLNQNELRLDLGKGSSESNTSSNSSSGCSSMSTTTGPPTQPQNRPPTQQQVRQPNVRSSGADQRPARQHQLGDDKQHCDMATAVRSAGYQQQQQLLQRRVSSVDHSLGSQYINSATMDTTRFNAQKTQSNPMAPASNQSPPEAAKSNRLPASQRNSCSATSGQAAASNTPVYSDSIRRGPASIDQLQQQQQHRQQTRRASVAVPDGSVRGRGIGKVQPGQATMMMMMQGRKQSSGNFLLMQSSAAASSITTASANNLGHTMDQTGRSELRNESLMVGAGHRSSQPPMHNNNKNHHHHQQQQQQFIMSQQEQPRTMVTASSELSMNQSHRRESSGSARGSIGAGCGALIPIPPDQIHLRRLSDQSNLVRRSSIIADTIDVTNMQHRNRSHSNIDTVSYAFYQPNFQLDYSDDILAQSSYAANQQHLTTDDWPQHQHQHHHHHQQQGHEPATYGANQNNQQADHVGPQRQQMSSIITSYTQKHRRSSDDLHTDSSSDIDEELQAAPTNLEMLDNELQPNEYFAPPRALEQQALDKQQLGSFVDMQAGNIAIPSVSVSEFNSSQQRLNQIQQQQPRAPLMQLEQLMTSPIQINVAIEQAIQQQQQRQDLVQQYLPANDMLPNSVQHQHHQQLLVGYSALAPRRGSSGRILPQIPGDQSQSLLDLPHSSARLAPNSGSGAGSRNSLSNGFMNGVEHGRLGSTLDLPSASQTIRRASAPEGQNIKIVVDDMDGTMMRANGCCSGSMMMVIDPNGSLVMQPHSTHQGHHQNHLHHQYGKQGELYERLVLYRDDSLDPVTNTPRGFGLQVMGGKIDDEGKLQACVVWILPGGPADKVGLKCGDKIVEWDGKCLVNMTYEQVADVIESSANIAELLVRPVNRLELQPGTASVVRSQRRLSHQTERDLKKMLKRPRASEVFVNPDHQWQQQPQPQQPHTQPQSQPQPQQQMSRTSDQPTSHLLIESSAGQRHQQQAISAGNSPLRSGTGRKLPQIPGGQDSTGLRATLNDGSMISQMKLNSSSTSQLEQQTTGSYYASTDTNSHRSNNNQLLVGQLKSEQRTLSAQNASLQPPEHQIMSWQQQQQQQLDHNHNEVYGLMGLQVNVDERASQLEISVLSAINVNLNPSLDYYVRLRILPENTRFKACKTLPRSDMNWKETFLFQNFPIDQINRMALEIGIWVHEETPRLSAQLAQPICEAMIPIQSARERNTDFWPMRQPPSSPHARRKSLNDLLETHHRQQDDQLVSAQLSIGHKNDKNLQMNWPPANSDSTDKHPVRQQHLLQYQASGYGPETGPMFVRGRSSSNRNLPDTNKLRAQPRRASDEVAGGSSQRLSSRLSPAASRRSISFINVAPDGLTSNRPSSRLGSQSNLLKSYQHQRRDSTVVNQHPNSTGDSPVHKYGSPKGSSARVSDQQSARQTDVVHQQPLVGEGLTPSGRRSSLVGIHNMIGYTSQKSSLSDATEQKGSPKCGPTRSSQPASGSCSQRGSFSSDPKQITRSQNRHEPIQRASASSNSSQQSPNTTPVSGRAGNGSRRGSVEQSSSRLERRGSFAMLTLRKLKRTMSLTKGNEQELPDSNEASRRSSSEEYEADVGEDLGLTRRLIGQTVDYVGRLKLSFVMTKGQLEIDVISGQGLKYDQESCLGVYVKMYLKGRNKSNKRKTRLVQAWESPVFKQLIKYDGCLVDNKSLEVSLWQKQGGLRGKIPIGFTEVRLSELSLNRLETSWYNLRPMDLMCSSSVED